MNEFKKLYSYAVGRTFIRFDVPNTKFSYYRYIPRVTELELVKRISEKKANFEMSQSQNIIKRTQAKKIEKTFEGTLAELAIILFLELVYKIDPKLIKWYNIERKTFEFSQEEYDIRLNDTVDVGVRSSFFKESTNMNDVFFTKKMDYFLYQNAIKRKEKKDEFEMRVLYNTTNPSEVPSNVDEMINEINNGSAKLYIVGGIKCSEIINRGQVNKRMGQQNSSFITLNLKEGPSLAEFFFELAKSMYCTE